MVTEIVTIKWDRRIKKYYENKSYIYTKMGDEFEVRTEDLPDGSNILIDTECDGCGLEIKNLKWYFYKKSMKKNNGYYCVRCAKNGYKKWVSFFEWCYINLPIKIADKILSRWHYELNGCSQKDVTYSSHGFNQKGYWFKCLDHPEHQPEQKSISGFTNYKYGNLDCDQCNIIALTHPYLVKFLVNKEDAYKYSVGVRSKFLIKCPNCGHEKEMMLFDLMRMGGWLPSLFRWKTISRKIYV